MTLSDVAALNQWVLGAAFGAALLFGAVAQRSHFCTMGAVADVVNMGDWGRARMWGLAVATAMFGFGLMAGLGWIDPARSLYTGPRLMYLSQAVGGLLFGWGMVLASGCGGKTLIRMGAGNLKSVVVFLVVGLSAFATLKGVTAVLRTATVDQVFWMLPVGQDLPALLAGGSGQSRQHWALVLGIGLSLPVAAWSLWPHEVRSANTLLGGVGVGMLVLLMWWISGDLGFVPEHPETLEPTFLASNSKGMESFTFVAPMAYTLDWLMLFSDRSKTLSLGVVLPVGVVVGSAIAALASGQFRWEGFAGMRDTAWHLIGALMMGVGGVTAMGCTIGHGISGLSTLSVGSVLATLAMIAGAVGALHFQAWWLEREA